MIRIIPFDFEHMDLFEQTPEEIEIYGKLDSSSPIPAAEFGVAYTAICDGRIIGVGGLLQKSEHTGKCWVMLSKHAKQHGVLVFYKARQLLEQLMDDMKLHRVETANPESTPDLNRWCFLLGFVDEGPMRCYDDKKRTYIRFAKLRG